MPKIPEQMEKMISRLKSVCISIYQRYIINALLCVATLTLMINVHNTSLQRKALTHLAYGFEQDEPMQSPTGKPSYVSPLINKDLKPIGPNPCRAISLRKLPHPLGEQASG